MLVSSSIKWKFFLKNLPLRIVAIIDNACRNVVSAQLVVVKINPKIAKTDIRFGNSTKILSANLGQSILCEVTQVIIVFQELMI